MVLMSFCWIKGAGRWPLDIPKDDLGLHLGFYLGA